MFNRKVRFLEEFSLEDHKVFIVQNSKKQLYQLQWRRKSQGSSWLLKNLCHQSGQAVEVASRDLEAVLLGEDLRLEQLEAKITDHLLMFGVHMKNALQALEKLCGVQMMENADESMHAFHHKLFALLEEHAGAAEECPPLPSDISSLVSPPLPPPPPVMVGEDERQQLSEPWLSDASPSFMERLQQKRAAAKRGQTELGTVAIQGFDDGWGFTRMRDLAPIWMH